ncbi:response regulator, partial [bacterium]|nr:response regulator [bacterium]
IFMVEPIRHMPPEGARRARILVVDHHEKKREWLRAHLAAAGHEVTLAAGANDAERRFAETHPDVCLVALTLPRVPGSELAVRLRKTPNGERCRIILTSSIFRTMQVDDVARARWKADAFLAEPFSEDVLHGALATVLENLAPGTSDDGAPMVEPLEIRESSSPSPAESPGPEPEPESSLLVPMSGDLGEASVPEVVAAMFFARATGIVTFTRGNAVKRVFVREGLPMHVQSDQRDETLGQILRMQGLIDEDAYLASLASVAEGQMMGGALVDIGALTPAQVYNALKLQTHEKMLALFSWFDGAYTIELADRLEETHTAFEQWPPAIILEGIERHYDPASIREVAAEMKDFVLLRNPSPPVAFDELRLPGDAAAILRLADGKRTVAKVLGESPLDSARTFFAFYTLLVLEQFAKVDPGTMKESADELRSAQPSPDRVAREAIREKAPAVARGGAVEDADDEAALEIELADFETGGLAEDDADGAREAPPGPAPAERFAPEDRDESELTAYVERERKRAAPDDRGLLDEILAFYLKLPRITHYEVLGVDRGADAKSMDDAYRVLVKKLHSDRLRPRFSGEILALADAIVARATEAHDTLLDFNKRAAYEARLRAGGDRKERSVQIILAAERTFNAGMLAMRQQAWEKAYENFAEAVKMFPEEAEYHAFLGWSALHASGRPQGERVQLAREHLEKAIDLNPRCDKAFQYLGMLFKNAGDMDKAQLMFAQAFRFNKTNNEARTQLKILQMRRARRGKAPETRVPGARDLLAADVSFETVKKAILKIFW